MFALNDRRVSIQAGKVIFLNILPGIREFGANAIALLQIFIAAYFRHRTFG